MSPIAAMNAAAVWTLTPGMVISRRIWGEPSACSASARSSAPSSSSRKSTWRGQPSSVSRSSTGSSSAAGHTRPALPKQSLIGGRPHRLRASTACASLLARTRLSRRAHTRRSARICSSGAHTVSSIPIAASLASVLASSRSVLALARLICGSLRVLATSTRATRRSSRSTISPAPLVASSATTSSLARLCANNPGSATLVAIRPADRTLPSSQIATSQKSRWMSIPIRRIPPPSSMLEREDGCAHDTDGHVLTAHPGKSQGRPRTTPGSQPIGYRRPAPPVLPRRSPRPGTPILPETPDDPTGAVSSPDNGPCFKSVRFAAYIEKRPELIHIRTRRKSPNQNGVRERAFGSLKYEHLYRLEIDDGHQLGLEAERYRELFNQIRPHEALAMPPA